MKRGLIIGSLAVAVGIGAFLTFGSGKTTGGTKAAKAEEAKKSLEPKVVTITSTSPVQRTVQRKVSIVGSLWGKEEVVISPKVEGRIKKIYHDLGDMVSPGELLAEIDDVDFRLTVDEANRALDLELSRLGLKALPTKEFDVTALPSIQRSRAMLTMTRSKRDRLIQAASSISVDDRDTVMADFAVADANYRQAILEAEATLAAVRQRQAALESAKQRLQDTKITAPYPLSLGNNPKIKYSVAQRMCSEGQIVRTNGLKEQDLYRLVIDDPLKMQGLVPERHLAEVMVDQNVEISIEAYNDKAFLGKVTRVNPTIDRGSRTFSVEIEIPNHERKLRSGSFAKAEIITQTASQALTVPEEAIVTFAGVTKIFLVEKEEAKELQVKVGQRFEIVDKGKRQVWLEIQPTLDVNQKVIISGQTQLAQGTKVKERE
jgi:RND family efflux transporter MFP subunit